jgi:hypothetical protein
MSAIALGQAAFSRTGIEKCPGTLCRRHLASRRPGSQQPIVNKSRRKIHVIYQLVDRGVDVAANLAAITGACPLLVAALRGACHPNKSVPAMPKRNSGTGFLAAEMKEYDA